MFAPKRLVVAALAALAVTTAGTISYMRITKAEAAPVPPGKAARDLERAEREWRDQENHHTEEMVKARLDLIKHEEQFRKLEQESSALRNELKDVRKRIDIFLGNARQPQVPQPLQNEEKELCAREEKLRAEVLKARRKIFVAEEKVWQLEREQARQRERLRARLEAAEDKLHEEQGVATGNRATDLQRRLQDVEQQLERLNRQLAELRKQVQQKSP
jgi:hypothetical protein